MKNTQSASTTPPYVPEAIYVNEVMAYLEPMDLLDCRLVSRSHKLLVKGKFLKFSIIIE